MAFANDDEAPAARRHDAFSSHPVVVVAVEERELGVEGPSFKATSGWS